jgi:hypothetical protein
MCRRGVEMCGGTGVFANWRHCGGGENLFPCPVAALTVKHICVTTEDVVLKYNNLEFGLCVLT